MATGEEEQRQRYAKFVEKMERISEGLYKSNSIMEGVAEFLKHSTEQEGNFMLIQVPPYKCQEYSNVLSRLMTSKADKDSENSPAVEKNDLESHI